MTLRHRNRMRRTSGDQVVRDLQAAEACEQFNSSEPTRGEIERRAHEIYLSRNGAPGNAELDWLRAEIELRASTARRVRTGAASACEQTGP